MKIPAWLKCLMGRHDIDQNCDGYTDEEWECCHNCLRPVEGTLKVWGGKGVGMRPATEAEWEHFIKYSKKPIRLKAVITEGAQL